ncbi:hypothetical protein VNO77_02654 [Canavalia gladiata]|uniref:14-3-3 domain-containing protein n=1 Tax=Canavalia gladiata TaxID=3824 RepID=A0AAN9MU56_CANGL
MTPPFSSNGTPPLSVQIHNINTLTDDQLIELLNILDAYNAWIIENDFSAGKPNQGAIRLSHEDVRASLKVLGDGEVHAEGGGRVDADDGAERGVEEPVVSGVQERDQEYGSKVETELSQVCASILNLLDSNLVPSASSNESNVFYLKMKSDYHRYLAAFKIGDHVVLQVSLMKHMGWLNRSGQNILALFPCISLECAEHLVMCKVGMEVVGLGALKLIEFLREKMQLSNLSFQSLYTVRILKEHTVVVYAIVVAKLRCSPLDIERFKSGKLPLRSPNEAYANTLIKDSGGKIEVIFTDLEIRTSSIFFGCVRQIPKAIGMATCLPPNGAFGSVKPPNEAFGSIVDLAFKFWHNKS